MSVNLNDHNEIRNSTASKPQLSVIEELNIYVNSKIAKIIATGVVLCFILYHGFLRVVDGNFLLFIL